MYHNNWHISRTLSFEAQILKEKKTFFKSKNVSQRIGSMKCELDFTSIHQIILYRKQKPTLFIAAMFVQGNRANFSSTCFHSVWLQTLFFCIFRWSSLFLYC